MVRENRREAHVLVVEDAAENRHLVEIVLGSEGYSVQAAATGGEALAEAARRRPDLVVLDLSLPDMNGSDLILRLQERGVDSPVLVVTGDISPWARLTAQHVDAYLMKPFDIEALLQGVSALVFPLSPDVSPDAWQPASA